MKTKMNELLFFLKKPLLSKVAITLSSLAMGATLFSCDPLWPDQRDMPDALKKRLK